MSRPHFAAFDSSTALDVDACEKYLEISREPLGFFRHTKGELLEVAKNIMQQLAPFQMFIVGGAAQKILFDYPKNDLDIAIYSEPGTFELFLQSFIPFLQALGLQSTDPKSPGFIRINLHYQILSFFDIDVKFPSLVDRSHLFDDNALVVDVTGPELRMSLIPGCIFGQGAESLQHAITCNRQKNLLLSDPSGAKNYSLRTILRCTQGWNSSAELLQNALLCLQHESVETFQRNLDLFLLGHGHQNRPLFLMNLKNLLDRSPVNATKSSLIDKAFFGDGVPLLDCKKEIDAVVVSALRSFMDYDVEAHKFSLGREFFFLSKPLENTFLDILKSSTYTEKDLTAIIIDWLEFFESKTKSSLTSPKGLKIAKSLLKSLSEKEHKEAFEKLSAFIEAKEQQNALLFFGRLSSEGMLETILEKQTISEKEWEIFYPHFEKALQGISVENLKKLQTILEAVGGFKKNKALFLKTLIIQHSLDLEQVLIQLQDWGCEKPAESVFELLDEEHSIYSFIATEFASIQPMGPNSRIFWCLALKNPKILSFLRLEGLILEPFCKEAFIPILGLENQKISAFFDHTKEEWVLKIASLPTGLLLKEDWQILVQRLEDFQGCNSLPSQVGFWIQKVELFLSTMEKDLPSCRKELKSFPKELQACLKTHLHSQIFQTKKGAFEFFKGGEETAFEDAKYFDFLLVHYPQGIGEGFLEYALEMAIGLDSRNICNPRYLEFLRKTLLKAKGPLRSIVLDRLAQFEDFECNIDKEVFALALQKKRILPTKIQNFVGYLVEIPGWENQDTELLAPLFERSFLKSLDFSVQKVLIKKCKLFSTEDLALRVELLSKNNSLQGVVELLVEGAKQGLYVDFTKIIEMRPLFDKREDFLFCLPWKEILSKKKMVSLEVLRFLLQDASGLNSEYKQLLVEMFFGHWGRLTRQEGNLVSKMVLDISSLHLDWERIANEALEAPFFEEKTSENLALALCLAEKVRSKKKSYDPLKSYLIAFATHGDHLSFLTNKEVIEAAKQNPTALEPLLLKRINEGLLHPKDFLEILKKGEWTESFITSLLEGLEKKECLANVSQEILLLSFLKGKKPLKLSKRFGFFQKIAFEEYKKYAVYFDDALQYEPDSVEIYFNWLLQASQKKTPDLESLHALAEKILEARDFAKDIEWMKEPLYQLSSWPLPVSFLMVELAHQTLDAPLMVRCLFSLKNTPHFSENFFSHLWALEKLAQKEPIDFSAHENQMACAIIRHYWKENFLVQDAPSFNIVKYLPLFPKNAIELYFVQMVILLENFSQKIDNCSDLEKELLDSFGENLKHFMGCSLNDPRVELIYPLLDQLEDLLQKLPFFPTEKKSSARDLRNFFFQNAFFIKNLCVFAGEDLATKADLESVDLLRQELARKTTYIMMEILPSILDLENDPLVINGIFCSKELPVETTQSHILYIKAYFLLGQRLFLDKREDRVESHLLKILHEVLFGLLHKAISLQQLDTKSFKEFLFFKQELLTHFDHLKKEIQIGALELFTQLVTWAIGQPSADLKAELVKDLSWLKKITPTMFDLLGEDEKLFQLQKWMDAIKELGPSDEQIEDLESYFHAKKRASLMTAVFESPDFETNFYLYFNMVPQKERFVVFIELMDSVERRLSPDYSATDQSAQTLKSLQFFSREIIKATFQDCIFDKDPSRDKNYGKLLYRFMQLLAQRANSFEVKECFCEPRFPLIPLMESFVCIEFEPKVREEMLKEICIPLLQNFGYIFHPKMMGIKMDALTFLDEKHRQQTILMWLDKLEHMEKILFESRQFSALSLSSGLFQDAKMSLLARCEVKKIPEIRAHLESYFYIFKKSLLENIYLVKQGRKQPTPETNEYNRRRAAILVDVYKYIASCGVLFNTAQTQEIKDIRKFYLEEPFSTDSTQRSGAR